MGLWLLWASIVARASMIKGESDSNLKWTDNLKHGPASGPEAGPGLITTGRPGPEPGTHKSYTESPLNHRNCQRPVRTYIIHTSMYMSIQVV